MKKHIIALAALTTLAGAHLTASAQETPRSESAANTTESVLYGRVQTSVEGVRVNGPDYSLVPNAGSQNGGRVNSDNSFLGVRVRENLGSGNSAFVDLQLGVNTDDGNLNDGNGTGISNNNRLRRSVIGFQAPVGTVWAGRDETAYFAAGREFDPFYNRSSASTANILGRTPYSAVSLAPYTGFNSRFGNTVGYKSPSWYNTNVEASYTVNEHANLGESRVSSVSLNYRNDRLLGTLAFERQNHTDAFNSTGQNRDTAVKAALGYDLANNYRVTFVAERASNVVNTSFLNADYDRNAYSVGLTKYVGPGEVLASYTHARGGSLNGGTNVWGVPTASSDMGASQLSLGYRYNFSRRTNIIATATLLNNKSAANYDLNYRPVGIAPGQDVRVYGVGIEHQF